MVTTRNLIVSCFVKLSHTGIITLNILAYVQIPPLTFTKRQRIKTRVFPLIIMIQLNLDVRESKRSSLIESFSNLKFPHGGKK